MTVFQSGSLIYIFAHIAKLIKTNLHYTHVQGKVILSKSDQDQSSLLNY